MVGWRWMPLGGQRGQDWNLVGRRVETAHQLLCSHSSCSKGDLSKEIGCLLRLRGLSETEEERRESESNLPTAKAVVATQRAAQGRACHLRGVIEYCGIGRRRIGARLIGRGSQLPRRGLRSGRRSWAIDWAARSSLFLHAVPLPRVADLSWAASQDRLQVSGDGLPVCKVGASPLFPWRRIEGGS